MEDNFSEKYSKSNFLIQWLIERFFKAIKNTLRDIDYKRVLEIGAGPGFSTQYLSKFLRNKNFEASEYNSDLVLEGQKRNSGIKFQQESIYNLNRKNNSFDLLIVLEVLEHLDKPEDALQEISRVTSKYCLISVPNEPIWRILNIARGKYLKNFGNTSGHIQHWSKRQFQSLVGKYFHIVKAGSSFPWLIVLARKI